MDGIGFTLPAYPKLTIRANGLSERELWGRWSVSKRVSLLNRLLPEKFSLLITGGGYGPNLGARFKVCIGNGSRYATFWRGADQPETLRLKFSVRKLSNLIEMSLPHPTVPEQDSRAIGLGFVRLQILSDSFNQVLPGSHRDKLKDNSREFNFSEDD